MYRKIINGRVVKLNPDTITHSDKTKYNQIAASNKIIDTLQYSISRPSSMYGNTYNVRITTRLMLDQEDDENHTYNDPNVVNFKTMITTNLSSVESEANTHLYAIDGIRSIQRFKNKKIHTITIKGAKKAHERCIEMIKESIPGIKVKSSTKTL